MSKWDLRIDGDVLVYRAGFAADSRSEEVSHSLHNTKLIINLLKKKFPGDCTILLSGKDNFRSKLTPSYKLNRLFSICCDEHVTRKAVAVMVYETICNKCKKSCKTYSIKPMHYQAIREYLVERCGAIVTDWGEADDWLGVHPTPKTVIASIDKDLMMLPVYHYRLQSDKLIRATDPGKLWLSEDGKKIIGTGLKWFMAQMLLGDAVDNIQKPVKGLGPSAVFKLFNEIDDPIDMWKIVDEHYKDKDQLVLNGKLLWIARKPREIFSPTTLNKYFSYEKTNTD